MKKIILILLVIISSCNNDNQKPWVDEYGLIGSWYVNDYGSENIYRFIPYNDYVRYRFEIYNLDNTYSSGRVSCPMHGQIKFTYEVDHGINLDSTSYSTSYDCWYEDDDIIMQNEFETIKLIKQ